MHHKKRAVENAIKYPNNIEREGKNTWKVERAKKSLKENCHSWLYQDKKKKKKKKEKDVQVARNDINDPLQPDDRKTTIIARCAIAKQKSKQLR